MTAQMYARNFALDDIAIVDRAKGGDGRTVEAYAAVFNTPAEIHDHMGHYVERIDPRAFNRQLGLVRDDLSKVKVHYNHGFTLHGTPSDLGSVPIGKPMEIRADSRGLRTITRYNKSDLADAVLESIRNGEITGQSFRGQIYKSNPDRIPKARRGGELPTVTRLELGLIEYGPTPNPAYETAGILAVRSAEAFLASLGDRRDQFLEDLLRAATSTADPAASQGAHSATPDQGPGAADQPDGHSERISRHRRLRAAIAFAGVLK